MVSSPEVFSYNSPMSPSQSVTVKKPSARNHSISFQKLWKSNLRLLSSGYVLLNKRVMQLEMAVFCGPIYQRGGEIKESMKGSKNSLQLDYTTSSGCAVPNRKLLSNSINLRSSGETVSSKILFHLLVREIHNSIVSQPEEGGINEVRYA